jgi:hypothetical protein
MGKFVDSLELNGEVVLSLKEAIRQTDLEFEWIHGDISYPERGKVTKELFMQLKHFFNASTDYDTLDESN